MGNKTFNPCCVRRRSTSNLNSKDKPDFDIIQNIHDNIQLDINSSESDSIDELNTNSNTPERICISPSPPVMGKKSKKYINI
jgi:hypothetical protein